ncbi:hypothetical protein KY362_02985 [Candidatus Woesearchaeota archaeon]|nr:hypothetical protein [Candidatus Woesearchaeota archaeon]
MTKRSSATRGVKKAKKGKGAAKKKAAPKRKAAPTKIQLEPLHTETLGAAVTEAPSIPPGLHVPQTHKVEDLLAQEVIDASQDLFEPGRPQTLTHWFKMYSPVVITLGVGLATYFYLVFYLFYPSAILNGHWFQLLLLLVFVFLLAGIFIYLGLRSELLFVRILSFIFVFIIFTFLLLFVLLAHTLT